jgi:hypothetical protein
MSDIAEAHEAVAKGSAAAKIAVDIADATD